MSRCTAWSPRTATPGTGTSEMGGTARGAGRSGAQHAMAVNETIAAFVLGGRAPGAAGGVGTVRSWSTETEFLLPGGKRKVRPDGVWQAPEIGVPVLMVEVDRSTMAPADVAAKFPRCRELFRTKVRDNDPALANQEPADRTVHWWRRTWPDHTRPGYPPVALVVTDAGPLALANRQQAVADLSADCWRGRWCREVRDYNDDGWREYDAAVPIVATILELLAEHGPLGPVWWRFGRSGRHSLIEALENPNSRAAYDLRQAAREDEEHKAHQELMDSLVCIDCDDVPEEETTWEYGRQGQVEWTRRPGGRCWPCHQEHAERLEREAEEQLEAAREANAALRPCWTCRGSIGGEGGLGAGADREGWPGPAGVPRVCTGPRCKGLGPADAAGPDQARAGGRAGLHSGRSVVGGPRAARKAPPGEGPPGVTCWLWWAWNGPGGRVVWTFGWACRGRLAGGVGWLVW
ncbi:replication-relaxation family protein [Kitasatospora sp. NPDC059571]|uniref:replication-relaxation family protein n=1 Tax=Kitasatospora sp. NPDC059571 TaxID=3346871 RepID=UPI003696990F